MKKLLLSFLSVIALAPTMSAKETDATWKFVSSPEELTEDAEYIIAYTCPASIYDVKCDIMSANACPAERGFYALPNAGTLEDGVISDIQGNPAIFKVTKDGDNFNLFMTNAETPGYLTPVADGKNGLILSDTAMPISIRMGMGTGDDSGVKPSFTTFINFTGRADDQRAAFTWVNTPLSGKMTHIFWIGMQAESLGTLGFYKKVPGDPTYSWTASPAEYATVEEITDFTITFPNVEMIALSKTLEDGDYTATIDGEPCDLPYISCEGNTIKGQFKTPFTKEGVFRLKMAENLFYLNLADDTSVFSPEIEYELTVKLPEPTITGVTITPEPGKYEGLDLIKEINIDVQLSRPVELAYDQNVTLPILLFEEKDGTVAEKGKPVGYYIPSMSGEKLTLKADFAVPASRLVDGNYTVTIPENFFLLPYRGETIKWGEKYELVYEMKVKASVDAISGADETYDVYTATGIRILYNAGRDAVNALPAGLYIVNGKKIIRK